MAAVKVRAVLLLLCGPPAAGKTALAEHLRAHYSKDTGLEFLVITYDAFYPGDKRTHVNGSSSSGLASDFSTKHERSRLNNCLNFFISKNKLHSRQVEDVQEPAAEDWQRFSQCVSVPASISEEERVECSGIPLVLALDDNMLLKAARHEYYKMARDYGLGLCTVYITSELDVALERNRERGLPVSQDTVRRMHEGAEPPNDREVNCLVLDSSRCRGSVDFWRQNQAAILLTISGATIPPVVEENIAEKEASRESTLSSRVHQADLILRKCVSVEMANLHSGSSYDTNGKKKHFELVNRVKREVLEKLREGLLPTGNVPTSQGFKDYIERTFKEFLQSTN